MYFTVENYKFEKIMKIVICLQYKMRIFSKLCFWHIRKSLIRVRRGTESFAILEWQGI